MIHRVRLALAAGFALLLILLMPAARAETPSLKGVALVIGQSKYERLAPLANPSRDAEAVAATFRNLGFTVSLVMDRSARQLRRDLDGFAEDAEGADAAVVYYAGHGIEAAGENWLVPVDADISALESAGRSLVPLSALKEALQASAVPLTLLFLDACRDSPFPPGAALVREGQSHPVTAGGLGLTRGVSAAAAAQDTEGLGSVIGFAAEPGRVALDGPDGGNSFYAAAIVRHLAASTGLEFGTVMRMVTQEVYLKTGGAQRPWVNETLTRLLYFGGSTEDQTSDEGRLDAGRRALLLSIDALPQDLRKTVEQLAAESGLPLDPIFGMLKALQVDTAAGPDELDRQLRAGVEAVKKLKAERDIIARTDPEIIRLTAFADRAEAEGAIPLALDYRAQASARAKEVASASRANIAQARDRLREAAATYAKEAKTAILDFDHERAASLFGLAYAEVEGEDRILARIYKWEEANALASHGDYKGDNAALAAAITAYSAALEYFPRGSETENWTALQNSLGNALRILGSRESGTTRLEEAVLAYRAALEEWTRDRAPLDWATAQNNLGNALGALGRRESGTERLEEAAQAYRAALEERTRERLPFDWAATQNNLGTVLSALGGRENGTARLEEAVKAYRAALQEWTRERAPLDWATTQNNLGTALRTLGERESSTVRMEEAVQAFEAALQVWTRERVPLDWAMTQNNLGNVLYTLGGRENGTARLEEAVQAYRAALEERTRDRVPLDWAMTQNNLGSALRTLGERESGTTRLEEAVQAYRSALQEWTRERVPLDWATTQNNLGNVLSTLGGRESGTARLEEAVQAYRAALEEWTRERVPLDWAMTQNNLGTVLSTLGEREDGTARLEESVQAYRAALEERTRERVPLKWAMTQNNLGATLRALGEREGSTARLEEAVQAYRAALQEWTRERVPLDWATTQNNLGAALRVLGEREGGTARLDEAVLAFRAVLEERSRERVPLDWATTQHNLARAMMLLGERNNDSAMLREGRTAMNAAWEVDRSAGYTQYDKYYQEQIEAFDALLKTLNAK